jgi:uncharacterized protein YfbU (UPF0304 family)
MKFTDEQRLIVYMLSGVQQALKVQNELDPEFIQRVTARGDEWAILEKYPWLDQDGGDAPEFVVETRAILQAFRVVYRSLENLSEADLGRVQSGTGRHVLVFDGFDGNNEADHYGAADLITKDAGRWPEFASLAVNSHHPTLHRYRVILDAVSEYQSANPGGLLSADQLIGVVDRVRKAQPD